MRGFIYTLVSLLFIVISIAILLLSQSNYYQDSYSNKLLIHYLNENAINVLGIDIYYDNGTIINETLPLPNETVAFYSLEDFYYRFDNLNVSIDPTNFISFTGPVNYTHLNLSSTKIEFPTNASVKVNCTCTNLSTSFTSGTHYYDITLITSNGTYHFSGYISGEIKSNELNATFGNGTIFVNGVGALSYKFPEVGTFLSNINYSISIGGQLIEGYLKVRT